MLRLSYLLASSAVFSSPRLMMASISSSIRRLKEEVGETGDERLDKSKESHLSRLLIIFSAPCWIISSRSSLFWATVIGEKG